MIETPLFKIGEQRPKRRLVLHASDAPREVPGALRRLRRFLRRGRHVEPDPSVMRVEFDSEDGLTLRARANAWSAHVTVSLASDSLTSLRIRGQCNERGPMTLRLSLVHPALPDWMTGELTFRLSRVDSESEALDFAARVADILGRRSLRIRSRANAVDVEMVRESEGADPFRSTLVSTATLAELEVPANYDERAKGFEPPIGEVEPFSKESLVGQYREHYLSVWKPGMRAVFLRRGYRSGVAMAYVKRALASIASFVVVSAAMGLGVFIVLQFAFFLVVALPALIVDASVESWLSKAQPVLMMASAMVALFVGIAFFVMNWIENRLEDKFVFDYNARRVEHSRAGKAVLDVPFADVQAIELREEPSTDVIRLLSEPGDFVLARIRLGLYADNTRPQTRALAIELASGLDVPFVDSVRRPA